MKQKIKDILKKLGFDYIWFYIIDAGVIIMLTIEIILENGEHDFLEFELDNFLKLS